jgi:RHS repeat-associated protein
LWTWESEAFGDTPPNQNPSGQGEFVYNLRFPGQYYDSETGLNYNMARYYNPKTGRYDESDPIGLAGGINTYSYVGNNPVNLIDPLGLETVAIINNNGIGHAGLVVGSGNDGVLYDPGGSYRDDIKGSGQALYGDEVNQNDYINYQREDGSDVEVIKFPTTPEQEEEIKKNIENQGGCSPLLCAICSGNVLRGVGPFKNLGPTFTPGMLGRQLRKIK